MQVWIGTSGYSYPDWVGPFYPPETRPNRMLAHYTRIFPLVELNFTFYRLPAVGQLARLGEQTPAGFQFLVKLPRTISHERRLDELLPFRRAVEELQQRGRLLGLLCQLPQSCHHDRAALGLLDTLAKELGSHGLAVEFRHHSWARPDVTAWLAERPLDLVAVDVPELPGLYPRGLVQSGPRLYIRFHSRSAANWYGSDKDRYDYDYSDAELMEWAERLQRAELPSVRAVLLFNNCQRSQAAQNARRMQQLLAGRGLELVEPFGTPPDVEQRLLFE
jgi:uncharacterized protein YecE (DUF72 family)